MSPGPGQAEAGQGGGHGGLGVPLLGAGALQVAQLGGDPAQQPAPVRAHYALGTGQRGEHCLAYRTADPLPAPAGHGGPDQAGNGPHAEISQFLRLAAAPRGHHLQGPPARSST